MSHWSEIRTAYQVGRLGTVTAAADFLGVHRATVVRHIETLETALGGALFLRDTKGYAPTELGADMMRVAEETEDRFARLAGRAKGYDADLSGEFLVTASGAAAPFVLPVVSAFRREHPQVQVRFLSSDRIVHLEHGDAHVAVRAGKKPTHPDLVVQSFNTVELGLYAHQSYVAERGLPAGPHDYGAHYFVGPEEAGAPARVVIWYRRHIPTDRIVFRAQQPPIVKDAVLAGLGIGFLPTAMAKKRSDLTPVNGPRAPWRASSWLVTHRDLHRSAKIQAFIKIFKSGPSWDVAS